MIEELDVCRKAFAEVEAQRGETLADLGEWLPQDLSFRPAPGSWCAIEVLDHIVRAESGTIAAVRTGLKNPHILGTEERPRVAALDRALRSEQSFRIPAGAGAIYPDAQTTFSEVAQRWDETREELGQLVEQLSPTSAHGGVFDHPFAGWMTFAEVIDHFSAHLYHHRFQLARLKAGCTVFSLKDVRT